MKPPRSNPFVAYLQTAQDTENAVARKADLLVALLPEAADALDEQGRSYLGPSDFFEIAAFERYARDAHERRVAWISSVDAALTGDFPEFKEAGFHPLRLYAHLICSFHESVMWSFHIIDRSLARLAPSEVWFAPQESGDPGKWPPIPVPRPDLHFRESIHSLVISALCTARGIPAHEGPAHPIPASANYPEKIVMTDTAVAPGSWLFLTRSFELPPVENVCRHAGIPTIFGEDLARIEPGDEPDSSLRERLGIAFSRLSADTGFWNLFGESGASLRTVAFPKMAYIFQGLIPALWRNFQTARSILSRVSPEVVIGATCGSTWDILFLPAAQSLGIPTVQYSHWWSYQWDYPWAWEQLPKADCYLTWDSPELACNGLDEIRERAVTVGSARLESLSLRTRPEEVARIRGKVRTHQQRPVCLYVPTWVERSRRFIRVPEEPVWQNQFQRRLLALFREYPSIDFYWRPHMPWGLDPRRFLDPFPSNVQIFPSTPARELIPAADVIVLDDFSSPFVEAAVTQAPILMYLHPLGPGIPSSDLPLVRRRAAVFHDNEAFFAGLEEFLRRGDFSPIERPDDAFLLDKNTDPSDDRAAMRAMNAIANMLEPRAAVSTLTRAKG